MAYDTRQILVGAAAIYLSTKDSLSSGWTTGDSDVPNPAVPAGTAGQTIKNALDADAEWRNVGYTSEGVEFAYEPDYGEVEVDQLLDAAKLFKQKMTASVNTSLAEATLENLIVSWAQSSASHKTTGNDFEGTALGTDEEVVGIEAGALGVEPVERSMVFVGLAPRKNGKKRERIYHVRRALNVEASTHSLKRNEATMFPVSFRLLPANVSGAEYGSIKDRVIS